MLVVTGGAGFIGSNLVNRLNQQERDDILVVDDLTDGAKFKNLVDCRIADYLDKDDFLHKILHNSSFASRIEAIFHQGACSTTTEWDGRYMMRNNYEYSKTLLHYCLQDNRPFIYASSAAVYGNKKEFQEVPRCEAPLNIYGYSKLQFDNYVRQQLPKTTAQIAGFRYFNVYGPREQHRSSMASVALHCHQRLLQGDEVRLFASSDGYAAGEQCRDFVYVDDVVDVNLWFFNHPQRRGIFNIGSGRSQTFNAVAQAVIKWHQRGEIHYIPFPDHLVGHYQSFTQADINALRKAGYSPDFRTVEEGIPAYLDWLKANPS